MHFRCDVMWVSGYRYLFCFFFVTVHGSTNGLGPGALGFRGVTPGRNTPKIMRGCEESKGIPGPQPPSQTIGWFGWAVDKRLLRDWTFKFWWKNWFWKQQLLFEDTLQQHAAFDQTMHLSEYYVNLSIVNCFFADFAISTTWIKARNRMCWYFHPFLVDGCSLCGKQNISAEVPEATNVDEVDWGCRGNWDTHGRSWEVT